MAFFRDTNGVVDRPIPHCPSCSEKEDIDTFVNPSLFPGPLFFICNVCGQAFSREFIHGPMYQLSISHAGQYNQSRARMQFDMVILEKGIEQ